MGPNKENDVSNIFKTNEMVWPWLEHAIACKDEPCSINTCVLNSGALSAIAIQRTDDRRSTKASNAQVTACWGVLLHIHSHAKPSTPLVQASHEKYFPNYSDFEFGELALKTAVCA